MKKTNVVKLRMQYVKSCEYDVQFAKDQIEFWKKHLKNCQKYLKQSQSHLQEAKKREANANPL